MTVSANLLIVGDFNLHIDNGANRNVANFIDILSEIDLKQLCLEKTHIKGHILYLVITREHNNMVNIRNVLCDIIADHYSVFFTIDVPKLHRQRVTFTVRKLSKIPWNLFSEDIGELCKIQ